MYMLARITPEIYEWQPVNPDLAWEPRKQVSRIEAREIMATRGCPHELLETIMSETTPGLVMT